MFLMTKKLEFPFQHLNMTDYSRAEQFLNGWLRYVNVLRFVAMAALFSIAFFAASFLHYPKAAVALGVVLAGLQCFSDKFESREYIASKTKMPALVGLVALGLCLNELPSVSPVELLPWALLAKHAAAGAAVGLVGAVVLTPLAEVANLFVLVVNAVPAFVVQVAFRRKFPDWGETVEPVATGVSIANVGNSKVFVSHPSLRGNVLGAPAFSYGQLMKREVVAYQTAKWVDNSPSKDTLVEDYAPALAAAMGVSQFAAMTAPGSNFTPEDVLPEGMAINPATGLPMLGSLLIDMGGNSYGTGLADIEFGCGSDMNQSSDFGGFDDVGGVSDFGGGSDMSGASSTDF